MSLTRAVAARLRMLGVCYWLTLKTLAASAFDGIFQVLWPLFFATTAFLVFRQNGDPATLVYAGLGSAVMGTWSTIATTGSSAMQRERWMGTLELLIASPTRFAWILTPVTTAMASLAMYSLVATLVWGRVLFGIEVSIGAPLAFVVALMSTVLSIAMFGFLLAVSVVRYRTAWALGNVLEYPGWLLCGFLVPLALLPAWAGSVAKALPPTWGMEAIRLAAAGQDNATQTVVCAGLGLLYAVAATLLSERVIDSARRHATLALT